MNLRKSKGICEVRHIDEERGRRRERPAAADPFFAYRRKIVKFLKQNDPKMIFIYGQNDPWTAAGVTWLKGKKNIHVFVQPGGSHLARISTLPEAMRVRAIAQIEEWISE